jgi:hypothetical protein
MVLPTMCGAMGGHGVQRDGAAVRRRVVVALRVLPLNQCFVNLRDPVFPAQLEMLPVRLPIKKSNTKTQCIQIKNTECVQRKNEFK